MDKKFTKEDLDYCWPYYKDYFIEILNGEYPLDDAIADLWSLVGSGHDNRLKSILDDNVSCFECGEPDGKHLFGCKMPKID